MTPVHLYGVLEVDATMAPLTRGLDSRVVRALPLDNGRSAWVSDVAASSLEATATRLREHDAVLRSATAAGYAIVPSLFGRLHADDEALIAALERSEPDLAEAMALVRGRVEMSLLVAASGAAEDRTSDAPAAIQGPGRAHLNRLQHRIHAERLLRGRARDVVEAASRELGELIVAERVVEEPAPPVLEARAHLVARENVARYLETARAQAAAADPAMRLKVLGPGAAYSFAAVQIA